MLLKKIIIFITISLSLNAQADLSDGLIGYYKLQENFNDSSTYQSNMFDNDRGTKFKEVTDNLGFSKKGTSGLVYLVR